MGKRNKSGVVSRLRDLIEDLGRLLNPPKPVPVPVPVRKDPRIPNRR